jgi:hypothetical protein
MKVSGCGKLSRHPLTGHWYRALNLKHWKSRLATKHTMTARSRFSAATPSSPLYRILYLGENHQVAIYEVGAKVRLRLPAQDRALYQTSRTRVCPLAVRNPSQTATSILAGRMPAVRIDSGSENGGNRRGNQRKRIAARLT